MVDLALPDMRRWRYATLGACQHCGHDEAPGVRLYTRREAPPGVDYERPRCCACARLADAVRVAERIPIP